MIPLGPNRVELGPGVSAARARHRRVCAQPWGRVRRRGRPFFSPKARISPLSMLRGLPQTLSTERLSWRTEVPLIRFSRGSRYRFLSVLCASGMHSNSKERRSVADLLFLTDRRDTKQIGRQQRHHEQHVSQTACSTSFGSGIPLRPGVQRQLDSLAHDLVRADHLP